MSALPAQAPRGRRGRRIRTARADTGGTRCRARAAPQTMPHPAPPSVFWSRLALAGLAAFVLAAVALHLLRPDLDPVAHQMSLYLIGPWGPLLQAAYVALAVAMVGLAWGLYRAAPAPARSAAPLLAFALAAISLATTAYAWMDMPGVDRTLEGLVHGISAQAAFLFATTGLVLQALRLRRDPAWRAQARWLLPWALACFAAVWVLAMWRDLPRGLAQKAVIAMITGWLGAAAMLLLSRQQAVRATR